MNGTRWDTVRLARRWKQLDHAAIVSSRPGVRFVELPRCHLRVRIAGAGATTIVFACDPPNVVEQYDEILERLAPDYRVVVVEQPGFGFSFPKPGFAFTLDHYADAYEALLRELGLAPYVLVFPCISAYAALRVAATSGSSVEKLVLMQATSWSQEKLWLNEVAKSFVFGATGIPFGNHIGAIPYFGQALFGLSEARFPELTHPFAVHGSTERPALLAKFLVPGKEAFRLGACNCMPSLYQKYFADDDARLRPPTQPTLVLWGNRDYWHDNRDVDEAFPGLKGQLLPWLMREVRSDKMGLLHHAPHARFAEIEGAGHHLELEDPPAVCARIREFVGNAAS